MSASQTSNQQSVKAWAFFDDHGDLIAVERRKPRRIRRNVYNTVWIALGYKPEPVLVTRLKKRTGGKR